MIQDSKTFNKAYDPAKDLFKKLLDGNNSRYMDLDLFCHTPTGWVIFEFLKCDTVSVENSHPNRYYSKNWRKFWQLYCMARDLGARLYLINYDDSYQDFKLMRVKKASHKDIETIDTMLNYKDLQKIILNTNKNNCIKTLEPGDITEI